MSLDKQTLDVILADVKNYLDITFHDEATDFKLLGMIERGVHHLQSVAGGELNFIINETPKALLLDYCRYARSNALEMFEQNYLSELVSLRIFREVSDIENQNPVTDGNV